MALEFKLPDIGEGIAEGEIVKWHVSSGDSVEEHQTVVEVMTDKATVEIPAPKAGTITELRAEEGDTVPVGDVIFVLDADGGGSSNGKESSAKSEDDASKKSKQKPASGSSSKESEGDEEDSSKKSTKQKQPSGSSSKGSSGGAKKSGSGGGGSIREFKLPDIGEGIAEGEIVKWHVSAGDSVDEHQTVVEVMTDKATVEIPAPAAGTIASIEADEGDTVPVGTVIFRLQTGAGGASDTSDEGEADEASVSEAPAQKKQAKKQKAGSRSGNGRVLAVPSARRVARELGIDLGDVEGSGRNGVVRRADVEAYAESGGAATEPAEKERSSAPAKPAAKPVSIPVGDRETRKPFRGVRRKIAEAMSRSMFTATHFTVVEEVDVTDLVELRAKAKAIGAKQDVKVTYMPFLMKAASAALHEYPPLNSQLDESTQEIVTYHYVNLGIATDTKNGLIVPVIDDVQSKGILQLSSELSELAEKTRSGKVSPDDLKGGTFTITNAGSIGGTLATPIINFPEVAIMGVHRIVKRPGIVETPDGDEFAVRHYMNLSLSVDHRLVDGADAARFLVHVKTLLEDPGLLSL